MSFAGGRPVGFCREVGRVFPAATRLMLALGGSFTNPGRSLTSNEDIDFILSPTIPSTGVPSILTTESCRMEESEEAPVLTDKTVIEPLRISSESTILRAPIGSESTPSVSIDVRPAA